MKTLFFSFILCVSVSAIGMPVGLINTGADPNGFLLPDGSVQPGWTITKVDPLTPPGGLTPSTPPYSSFVVSAYFLWIPVSAGSASKWISYSSPLYTGLDIARNFVYELDFQGSPADSFVMRVSADNGTKVYLNQISDSNLLLDWSVLDPNNFRPFVNWSPWVSVSDLLDGDNKLICDVSNLLSDDKNPTGLRVEFLAAAPSGITISDGGCTSVLAGLSLIAVVIVGRLTCKAPRHSLTRE